MRDDSRQCFKRYKNGVMDALKFDRFESKIADTDRIIFVCSAMILVATTSPKAKDDLRQGYLAITDHAVYIQQEAIWDEPLRVFPLSELLQIEFKCNQMSGAEFTFVFPDTSIRFPVTFNKKTSNELYHELSVLVPAQMGEAPQQEEATEDLIVAPQESAPDEPAPEESPVEPAAPEETAETPPAPERPDEPGAAQPEQPKQDAAPQEPAPAVRDASSKDGSAAQESEGYGTPEQIDQAITSIEKIVQDIREPAMEPQPFIPPKLMLEPLRREEKKPASPPADQEPSVQAAFIADELLKLKELLDMGLLTQEEFEYQKKKILSLR